MNINLLKDKIYNSFFHNIFLNFCNEPVNCIIKGNDNPAIFLIVLGNLSIRLFPIVEMIQYI